MKKILWICLNFIFSHYKKSTHEQQSVWKGPTIANIKQIVMARLRESLLVNPWHMPAGIMDHEVKYRECSRKCQIGKEHRWVEQANQDFTHEAGRHGPWERLDRPLMLI